METIKSIEFKNSFGYVFQWIDERLYIKHDEKSYSFPVSATIDDLKLYIDMYNKRK